MSSDSIRNFTGAHFPYSALPSDEEAPTIIHSSEAPSQTPIKKAASTIISKKNETSSELQTIKSPPHSPRSFSHGLTQGIQSITSKISFLALGSSPHNNGTTIGSESPFLLSPRSPRSPRETTHSSTEVRHKLNSHEKKALQKLLDDSSQLFDKVHAIQCQFSSELEMKGSNEQELQVGKLYKKFPQGLSSSIVLHSENLDFLLETVLGYFSQNSMKKVKNNVEIVPIVMDQLSLAPTRQLNKLHYLLTRVSIHSKLNELVKPHVELLFQAVENTLYNRAIACQAECLLDDEPMSRRSLFEKVIHFDELQKDKELYREFLHFAAHRSLSSEDALFLSLYQELLQIQENRGDFDTLLNDESISRAEMMRKIKEKYVPNESEESASASIPSPRYYNLSAHLPFQRELLYTRETLDPYLVRVSIEFKADLIAQLFKNKNLNISYQNDEEISGLIKIVVEAQTLVERVKAIYKLAPKLEPIIGLNFYDRFKVATREQKSLNELFSLSSHFYMALSGKEPEKSLKSDEEEKAATPIITFKELSELTKHKK